jgi:hypothetical protein
MGKVIHVPEGQDFFSGGGAHTQANRDFGFKGSMTAKVMPAMSSGGAMAAASRGMATGGRIDSDMAQDKAMVKKGIRQHETQEHGGKHADIKLRKGGMPKGMSKMMKAKGKHKAMPPKGMRNVQKPPAMPMAANPMMSGAPPAPDFNDGDRPPQGITTMRRGGKVGCR